jgi:hypothetical protein
MPSVQSVQSIPESSNSGHSPNTRKRRREGEGARRIVVANFSNETDALEILANAATDDKKDQAGDGHHSDSVSGRKVTFQDRAAARIDDFVLVKKGVLDVNRLELLVRAFFEHHHPALVREVMAITGLEGSLIISASLSDRAYTSYHSTAGESMSHRAVPRLCIGRCVIGPSSGSGHEGDTRKDLGNHPRCY